MKPKVLVIEDNDANMDFMLFVLSSLDLSVIPALNGPAGLAIAKSEHPDMILCDIQMPHLDGYAVLHALKSNLAFSTIPVIAVTAMTKSGDGERLLEKGFDGYLSKPVDSDQLKVVLAKWLPSWGPRKIR